MHVYTVALAKGGSAKTATAAEIVATLARMGQRVLAIDLDQQGNLTKRLGVTDDTELAAVAADVLTGGASASDATVPSPTVPGAHVIVGTHDLANIDNKPEVITSLRDYLPTIAGEWDAVVLDTPPAMGLVTLAALAAGDTIVAAVACSTEAYDQLGRLTALIEQRIEPRMRPGQRVHWVIPTLHDRRRLLDREVVEALNEEFPGRVTVPIREAVAVRDAYTAQMPISVYDPTAKVTADYHQATTAIISQAQGATTDQTDTIDQPDRKDTP